MVEVTIMKLRCPSCQSSDVWVDVAGLAPAVFDNSKMSINFDEATLAYVEPGYGTCGACNHECVLDLFIEAGE